MNAEKFRIELIQSSGLGNIVDLLAPDVFLKENSKKTLFKFMEVNGNISANSVKYQGDTIRPPSYEYLFRYDLFYFYWDGKLISMDKNGVFSSYTAISQIAPKFIIKNDSESIVAYPETPKKMTVLIHCDSEDMLGEVSKMLEINLNSNIHSAFLLEDNILLIIDEFNQTTSFSLAQGQMKKLSSCDLYPNQALNSVRTSHRSTAGSMNSAYGSLQNYKFCLSNGFLLAQNVRTSIFDLFTMGEEYRPKYVTSLKTQLSQLAVANIHLNFFGYPIITIFEKKQKGFQIISYLFFENNFVILGDKKVLNFEFIKKIRNFGSRIYVVGGNPGADGGRVVGFSLNL
jgi:hypothetical protein